MLDSMTVVTPKHRSHLPGTLRNTHRTRSQLVRTLDPQRVDVSEDKSPGERDLAPESADCQLSTKEKVDEEAKKTRRTFLDNMDAIAFSVQAWFEDNTAYSRRVHETTVDIARALGMPEDEVEKWAASRLARLVRDTEKLNAIKSLLQRLQESALANQVDDMGRLTKTRRS